MNINPGELNKRIEILEKVLSQKIGENGFREEIYRTVRKPYASFKRTTGKEKIQSGTEIEVVEARFIVRASKIVITNKMIIRYNGKLYDITYVNDYGDSGEYLELWVRLEECNGTS